MNRRKKGYKYKEGDCPLCKNEVHINGCSGCGRSCACYNLERRKPVMKTIEEINKLLRLIDKVPIMEVDGNVVGSRSLGEVVGEENETVLHVCWDDKGEENEGILFEEAFTKKNFMEAAIYGNAIHLKNIDGDNCVIGLFDVVPYPIQFYDDDGERKTNA